MSTRKILLVDDSKSARYALRLLLQKQDCEVDTAESAEIALERVRSELPYAIFMDHLMPGMNGFEALDALKEDPRTARIPVVMCTSNDDEPYQRQAREKGALGILPKPATQERLSSILNAIDDAVAAASTAPAKPAAEETATAARAAPASGATSQAIAASSMTADQMRSLVQSELRSLLDAEVQPLIERLLDTRLDALQEPLGDSLLERGAAQLSQWMEIEMARMREEMERLRDQLATPGGETEELSKGLTTELRQIKAELMKKEAEHAQALVHKLKHELLPDLIVRKVDDIESQVFDRLNRRLGELSDRLTETLPDNPSLVRKISDLAETAAEQKAAEIATFHAREAVESSSLDQAGELSDLLMSTAEATQKRMVLLATGAAVVGVLSSLAVYFLLG
jgi:CheY-like chemotaxis protein